MTIYYPTFKYNPGLIVPSIDNLSSVITVNGQTGTNIFRYKGGDATITNWPAWGVGNTLGVVGSGTDPSVNKGSPLLGTNDNSVQMQGGEIYRYTTQPYADITTEDIYIEMLFKMQPTMLTEYVLTKFDGATGKGYVVDIANGKIRWRTGNGLNSTDYNMATYNTALDLNAWYFVSFYYDSSESTDKTYGWQVYVNNLNNSTFITTTTPNAIETLTASNYLHFGGPAGLTNKFLGAFGYIHMAKQANWFAGGATNLTDWAAHHQDRFYTLCGLYPQIFKGTKAPSAYTRASAAYLRKSDGTNTKYWYMGSGWPRIEKIKDANGNFFTGALLESSGENKCLQSQTKGTTWTKITAGDTVSSDQSTAPDGTVSMDAIIANASDAQHGYSQNVTVTAATWVYSEFMMKGSKDWAFLTDTTVANCSAYFDLANGVLGTIGASASAGMEDFGGGIYRCWISFTGTAAAHTFRCQAAHADGDNTFAGDGSAKSTYFWGSQIELGSSPSSYIPTTSASVVRQADVLYYKSDNGNIGGVGSDKQGTVSFTICSNSTNLPAATTTIQQVNDGGAAADSIVLGVNTSGYLTATFTATGGTARTVTGPSTNVMNMKPHEVRLSYKAGRAVLYVDGVAGTPITNVVAADIPDDQDRIYMDCCLGQTKKFTFVRRPVWSGRYYIQ